MANIVELFIDGQRVYTFEGIHDVDHVHFRLMGNGEPDTIVSYERQKYEIIQ